LLFIFFIGTLGMFPRLRLSLFFLFASFFLLSFLSLVNFMNLCIGEIWHWTEFTGSWWYFCDHNLYSLLDILHDGTEHEKWRIESNKSVKSLQRFFKIRFSDFIESVYMFCMELYVEFNQTSVFPKNIWFSFS
jgi:hypothetical protein